MGWGLINRANGDNTVLAPQAHYAIDSYPHHHTIDLLSSNHMHRKEIYSFVRNEHL